MPHRRAPPPPTLRVCVRRTKTAALRRTRNVGDLPSRARKRFAPHSTHSCGFHPHFAALAGPRLVLLVLPVLPVLDFCRGDREKIGRSPPNLCISYGSFECFAKRFRAFDERPGRFSRRFQPLSRRRRDAAPTVSWFNQHGTNRGEMILEMASREKIDCPSRSQPPQSLRVSRFSVSSVPSAAGPADFITTNHETPDASRRRATDAKPGRSPVEGTKTLREPLDTFIWIPPAFCRGGLGRVGQVGRVGRDLSHSSYPSFILPRGLCFAKRSSSGLRAIG